MVKIYVCICYVCICYINLCTTMMSCMLNLQYIFLQQNEINSNEIVSGKTLTRINNRTSLSQTLDEMFYFCFTDSAQIKSENISTT